MRRVRTGFTLLEAIVALAIVSIVCIGVLAAEGSGLRAEATAAQRLPLASLAADRMAALDADGGSLASIPDSLARGSFAPPFTDTRFTTRVERIGSSPGLYEVRVTVANDRDSVSMITRRYRPEAPSAP